MKKTAAPYDPYNQNPNAAPMRDETPERFPHASIPVLGPECGGLENEYAKRTLNHEREQVPKFGDKAVPKLEGDREWHMTQIIGLQPWQQVDHRSQK